MITKVPIFAGLLFSIVLPTIATAQGPRLDLSHLNRLTDKAENTVDVSVDRAMLEQAAGFLGGKGADAERLRATLGGIIAIYVRSFEFSAPNAFSSDDVERVRKQLTGQGWSRLVDVREKDELSEVYVWREKGLNGGIAVIAVEHDELTVVNIVGRVDLASLAALGPIIPNLPGVASGQMKK